MIEQFPLFPDQASSVAGEVDALYLFLVGLTVFFGTMISILVIYFAIRFRRGTRANRQRPVHHSLPLELFWSIIPLGITMVIFGWGASVFFHIYRAPDDAIPISVVGKQWMWKLQHLNGKREINELHVPVGRPVKLTLTSEDVIHSFYIPAFRVKQDAVPGRYTSIWFKATRPGTYHLFCAEYCGTEHSRMIGSIIVMEPDAFQAWMGGPTAGMSAVEAGERLFQNLGCVTCHVADDTGRGPSLNGVYGKPVRLEDGSEVLADEDYLRESIVEPRAKMVEGYKPLMPTFEGLVTEEGLMQIIQYIKSVGGPEDEEGPAGETGEAMDAGRADAPAAREGGAS